MNALNLKKFSSKEEFLAEASAVVLRAAQEAVEEHGIFLMGLSGGRTPRPLYEKMSREIDWRQSEFFIVDERNVPWTDDRSNYQLVAETFLNVSVRKIKEKKTSIPENFRNTEDDEAKEKLKHLHDFRTDLDRNEAVEDYANNILALAPLGLDLTILGVGVDGHFASIFPGDAGRGGKALTTETESFEVKERYSLSAEYIMLSRKLLVLLSGSDKQKVIDELTNGSLTEEDFPAKVLLGHPSLEILYLG